MNETSHDGTGSPLKGRKPKPRQGRKKADPAAQDATGGDGTTAAKSGRGIPPNPYCTCSPCKCAPPCTCGLELTATEIRTEWSAENEQLVYSVSEIWTPKGGATRAR